MSSVSLSGASETHSRKVPTSQYIHRSDSCGVTAYKNRERKPSPGIVNCQFFLLPYSFSFTQRIR